MMRTLRIHFQNPARLIGVFLFVFVLWFGFPELVSAATLRVSPNTGVYTTGSTFTVNVVVNSGGQSINAAEGTLSFNPREVTIVSVSRASSIFSLWVTEPTFSNSAGTISFSGGSPSGYSGTAGSVMSVTLRATAAGTPKLNFTSGSVLANDGRGTNVLTGMSGGTFTISAQTSTPEPERVIEYVPPANTPGAPTVRSSTHPDPSAWHAAKDAVLSWTLPAGVTGVRTLLDSNPSSVPTRVYESPIDTITLEDLDEGISFFHIQFRNEDGWGRVAHYRLAVDSERPESFSVMLPEEADLSSPVQTLKLEVKDATSPVTRYVVKINNDAPFEFNDENASGTLTLPALPPGYHALIVEAYDAAGNSIVGSVSFTIESFAAPRFTEYPNEINEEVIPVLRGETRPDATVEVTMTRIGAEPATYTVTSDAEGRFTFIPEGTLSTGVYELSAVATDRFGAQSEASEPIRIAVQQPGYVRVGSFIVSVLSIVLSLISLAALTIAASWYLVVYVRRLRRRVSVESREALTILKREFATLVSEVEHTKEELASARKGGKLTKAELEVFDALLATIATARGRVEKEVVDVDRVARGGGGEE